MTLTVRVIEYTVTVAGRDAPELFCLITDLRDHQAHPARRSPPSITGGGSARRPR